MFSSFFLKKILKACHEKLMYVWSATSENGSSETFPSGQGLRNEGYIMMMVIYERVEATFLDTTAVQLKYITTPPNDAVILKRYSCYHLYFEQGHGINTICSRLLIGHQVTGKQMVLSGLKQWQTVGICSNQCRSEDAFLKVVAVEAHTRNLGIWISAEVGYKSKSESTYYLDTPLLRRTNLSQFTDANVLGKKVSNETVQSIRKTFDPPFTIRSTDDIILNCAYSTRQEVLPIFGGLGSDNEMCFAVLTFIIDSNNLHKVTTCMSSPTDNSVAKTIGFSYSVEKKRLQNQAADGEPLKRQPIVKFESSGRSGVEKSRSLSISEFVRDEFLLRSTYPFGQLVIDVVDEFDAREPVGIKTLSNVQFLKGDYETACSDEFTLLPLQRFRIYDEKVAKRKVRRINSQHKLLLASPSYPSGGSSIRPCKLSIFAFSSQQLVAIVAFYWGNRQKY